MPTQTEMLRGLRAKRDELKVARERIDEQIESINNTIRAFEPESRQPTGASRRRKTQGEGGRTRVKRDKHVAQVLDILRKHPDRVFQPQEFRNEFGMPTTVWSVVDELAETDQVEVVDYTSGDKPVIKHKPVTVRPGEGVVQ